VKFRRARSGDIPALVRLWREMWEFHASLDPRYQATPLADRVMAAWMGDHLRSERACIVVAEERGLVGYVSGMILENPPILPWQFFGFISEISVSESCRRVGVGAGLVREMHDWFRSKRVPYVEVNVSAKNPGSRAFWRKHGYSDFLERLRTEL